MSTVLTRARRPGEAILSEASGNRSRDNLLLAENQDFPANSLLGAVLPAGAVTVTKTDVAGANKGVLTLAGTPYGAGVKAGIYRVVFIEPATDAGAFIVEDPTGVVVGNGTVGVAFTGVVKFTIADGTSDFVPGDTALIAVVIAGAQYKAFDPAATDGAQIPIAYSIYPGLTGAGETKMTAGITADAELMGPNIAWPSGISAPAKAAAIASLAAVGIKVR